MSEMAGERPQIRDKERNRYRNCERERYTESKSEIGRQFKKRE